MPSPLAKDLNNLPQTVHTLLQVPLWLKAQVACAVGAAPAEAAQQSAHFESKVSIELDRRVIWCLPILPLWRLNM